MNIYKFSSRASLEPRGTQRLTRQFLPFPLGTGDGTTGAAVADGTTTLLPRVVTEADGAGALPPLPPAGEDGAGALPPLPPAGGETPPLDAPE